MKRRRLAEFIAAMPRSAYILFKGILAVSCIILAVALFLLIELQGREGFDYGLYKTAMLFLETPSALLLVGIIGVAVILDASP
ncbi:MAG: hypothetical protein LUE06_03060 [Oscillospiraceae bacterium]|nr:hypothetical protein [Oscillospiraceae bacterium]